MHYYFVFLHLWATIEQKQKQTVIKQNLRWSKYLEKKIKIILYINKKFHFGSALSTDVNYPLNITIEYLYYPSAIFVICLPDSRKVCVCVYTYLRFVIFLNKKKKQILIIFYFIRSILDYVTNQTRCLRTSTKIFF